jgi:hypothetical protein
MLSLWLVLTLTGPARDRWAIVSAVLLLSFAIGGLLAFVVTNFGTMFRLRLLATAPLWVLPVLARQSSVSSTASRA